MKLDPNAAVLIVGLGLIGGSYAKGLKKAGHTVYAVDISAETIQYALNNNLIDEGDTAPDPSVLGKADVVVLALYPHLTLAWVRNNQDALKSGAIITDVTGVKSCIVYDIQKILRPDLEFIAAHPMAGKEVSGIVNSDEKIFYDANYIIVPTDRNSFRSIEICKGIGETLQFAHISSLPPPAHDEMIGFVSQLTHCIAICLMTCSTSEHLVDYTGDSIRDLTRIAKINVEMWSELFMLNRDALLRQMESFLCEFEQFHDLLAAGEVERIKEKMALSAQKRALFDRRQRSEIK